MNLFHLDHAGKTARVGFTTVPDERPKLKITQKTSAGPVSRQRVMNGIALVNPATLTADSVIQEDPELATALSGRRLDVELTAAWFDPASTEPRPIGDFKEIDIVFTPDGAEKERRPHVLRTPNLNALHPVKIGRRFPMADALTGFVFRSCYQLVHEDGLTMDFLHGLAKELHDKQEAAFLGAGPKGNLPLVVREKGSPWRAFLFGEVRGDEYKLVVMLSDQELKKPAPAPAKEEGK
jgi:hypothetical protein